MKHPTPFKYVLFLLAIVLLGLGLPAASEQEVLCFTQRITDAPSFNIYTGKNDANNPILWTHTIPAGILDSVVRVGLYIEAWDVDGPPINDEYDRVYFNGQSLGYLEGFNESWVTVEKTVPVEILKEGINNLAVMVDELGKQWKVTIRASELRFYCRTATPDFSLGLTPSTLTIKQGEQASAQVALTALNGFGQAVQLSVAGLPSGVTAQFAANPLTPNPQAETELTLQLSGSVAVGEYTLQVRGQSGGLSHEADLQLIVSAADVEPFSGLVSLRFSKAEASPGEPVSLELSIQNPASQAFMDVKLSLQLADVLKLTAVHGEIRPDLSGQWAIWRIPLLQGGQSMTFSLDLKVADEAKPQTIRQQAELNHAGLPQAILSDPAILRIVPIELKLTKAVNLTQVTAGQQLIYTLYLKNPSHLSLTGGLLRDVLPEKLEFISAQGPLTLQRQQNELSWTGEVPAQSELEWQIITRVSEGVFAGEQLVNSARFKATQQKKELVSNTVVSTVQGEPAQDSQITLSHRAEMAQADVGRLVRLRATVINRSASNLMQNRLEILLPSGFDYVPQSTLLIGSRFADPSGRGRIAWELPLMRPGEQLTLQYQVVIGASSRRGQNLCRAEFRAQDSTRQELMRSADARVNVASNGLVFMSGLQGTVYLDRDQDDNYSPSDKPLAGIEVMLSNGERVFTDEQGEYQLTNLNPGEYAAGINSASLDERFTLPSPSSRAVVLSDGMTAWLDLPVQFAKKSDPGLSRLQGRVFFDKNQNGRFDEWSDALVNVFRVRLDEAVTTSGSGGRFVLTRQTPGPHTLEIEVEGVKHQHKIELLAGPQAIDIPIKFSGIRIVIQGEKK